MSHVRYFRLINALGQIYDITTTEALFSSPKGMGLEREETYRPIGARFALVSSIPKQVPLEGKLILTPPDAYIKYSEFMEFCTYTPLTIHYKPIDEYEYYQLRGVYTGKDFNYFKEVTITEVDKGELTKFATLEVDIKMMPLTPWYRRLDLSSDVNPDAGLIWEQTSDWSFLFENENTKTITFESDSTYPSPIRLIIPGPADTPEWKHFVNGVLASTGKLNYTVGVNEFLVIDDLGDTCSMYIKNGSGQVIANVYQNSDFSTQRFMQIQNGTNSIVVDDATGNSINIQAEVRLYYESV